MKPRKQVGKIAAAITIALSFIAATLSPAAAAGGTLSVDMKALYGQTNAKNVDIAAGTPFQFTINYGCTTATPCTSPKITVPFAANLELGFSSAVGWTETRNGNLVTWTRASIPASSAGSISIYATIPAYTTPHGQVFSQTATMSGFQSATFVDTPVNLTAQVGVNTGASVALIAGGAMDATTTYRASVCVSAKPDFGPQEVESGSTATITLPPGATVIDDGGGTQVGNTLRFTLPVIQGYGCTDKIYKVSFFSSNPDNFPNASKETEIEWVGALAGEPQKSLGTNSSSFTIPDPDEAGESTISANLVTPRSGAGNPSRRAWIGEDVAENFIVANNSPSAWSRAIVQTDIPSIVKATRASGKIVGEGPAELWISRNEGELEKIYDFDGDESYNVNFYNAQDFPTGAPKLDPSDNVTFVELRFEGTIQPGESGTGLSVISTVRTNDRVSGDLVVDGDIGTFDVEAKVKFPNVANMVSSDLQPLSFIVKPEGFGFDFRGNCVAPTEGGNCSNLPVGVFDATGRADLNAELWNGSTGVPKPVAEPVWVLTLPKKYFSLQNPEDPESNFRWLNLPNGLEPTLSWIGEVELEPGEPAYAYRWTFPEGTTQEGKTLWSLEFDFKMDQYSPVGNYGSYFRSPAVWASSATTPISEWCAPGNFLGNGADRWDLNDNGNVTETLCAVGTYTNPPANPGYSISQSMKGAWDSDFSTSPGTSYSDPQSVNQLRSAIKNTGNVPLEDAILLTTMTRPGDNHILSPAVPRSPSTHTFPINAAGKPTVPEGAKAWWSTSTYPCVENLVENASCDESATWTDWDATPPPDLADVGAVKVTFAGMTLAPGATWSSTMDVVTPDEPPVEVDGDPCVTPAEKAAVPCEPTFAIPNTVNPTDPADDETAIGTSAGVAKRNDLHVYLAALESPDATLAMPSIAGPNPVAPEPEPYESQGEYGEVQSVNVWYPPNGTITLLDGDGNPATSVEVFNDENDKIGTYALDDDTCGPNGPSAGSCLVTFTPESSFAGGFAPAVKYQVANALGQTGDSTYQAFVNPPAAPDPQPVTSTGEGVTPQQSPALDVPEDGSVCILDATFQCSPTDEVVVQGVGTFTLDPETSIVTFVPELGYSGSTGWVLYQVTDSLGQTGINTYKPTVTKPAGPAAQPLVGEGPVNSTVSVEVDLPEDANVQILQPNGVPAGDGPVVIAGQGTYRIENGEIVFTPEADWSGTPQSVVYRITDSYGQSAESTFTPTIWGAAPVPVDQISDGAMKTKQSVTVPPPDGGRVKLLDCSEDPCVEADEVTVADEGVYTVNPATGLIEFQPDDEFTGETSGVNYRVIDDKDQSGDAKYTPTVWDPAPNPNSETTEGPMGDEQSVDITVPQNGSVVLLECEEGEPNDCEVVNSITILNVGIYAIDDNGKITFRPEPDFTGAAPSVKYRVTDEHDQSGESTYTATVWDAAPVAEPITSEGPMGEDQTKTVNPPAGGEIKLIAGGNPVNNVTVAGEGAYSVNPETGDITFTPEPDFSGEATPVSYRIIDAKGQNSTSTYTPTVWDRAPQPENKTTDGPMGVDQTVTVTPPSGGTTKLLDCSGDECEPVNSLSIAGEGNYEVDPETGEITFTPNSDFWGTATAVKYRLIDAKGQYGDANYQPQVWDPAPEPSNRTSEGAIGAEQSITVAKPEGGSVKLVDGDDLVDELVVPDEGTYSVDPVTGKITFVPEDGFTGEATPVTFRVTDEFDQYGEATYTPTVIPAPEISTVGPKQGPLSGGNTLTVKGTNLKNATVKVGGRTCTNVKVNSDGTSLTCTIPAGARVGGVTVAVTTPSGSDSVTAAYTYVENKIERPKVPAATKVKGTPKSKKVVVSWKTPANPKGDRPTQWYRIKLNLIGCKTFILNKKLSKNKHSYTFTRKYLLKHGTCKRALRGEIRSKRLRFQVRIEAFNSKGGGPVAAKRFLVIR